MGRNIALKVLLLTAYDASLEPLAKITVPRMAHYAGRHQCEFRVVPNAVCDRPRGWIKLPYIRQALTENFDYVLWLDVDALFVRDDIDIRSAVVPSADLHMSWHGPDTSDWRPPPGLVPHFNAGVMLISSRPWSREFFGRVWEIGEIANQPWSDQASILRLLGYDNLLGLGPENPSVPDRRHVARLDVAWNSIPGVAAASDPIINHYAGVDQIARLRLMEIDRETLADRENATGQARNLLARQLHAYAKDRRDEASEWRSVRGQLNEARAALQAIQGLANVRLAEIKSLSDQLTEARAELNAIRFSQARRPTTPLRQAVGLLRRLRA